MWKTLKSVLGGEEKPVDGLAPARDALAAHDRARAREILDAAEALAPGGAEAAAYLLELARLWRTAGEPARSRAALERAAKLPGLTLPRKNDIEIGLVRASVELGEIDDAVRRGEMLLTAADVPKSIDRALAVTALAEAIVAADPARVSALADESVPVMLAVQHPDLADLLVLRALARAVGGGQALLGNEAAGLDETVFTRLADAAIARAGRVDPAASLAVLGAIRDQILVRNAHDPCLLRLVQAMGDTARAAGDHESAIDAWDWLLVTHDNRGREKDAHAALLELCASYCDADRFADADLRYQEAVVRARGLGAAIVSRTHREVGLFEASRGDLKKAEQQLQRAIETGLDPVAKAEAQVALGALLVETDPGRARTFLEAGVAGLPGDHDDAVFAREQLAALP